MQKEKNPHLTKKWAKIRGTIFIFSIYLFNTYLYKWRFEAIWYHFPYNFQYTHLNNKQHIITNASTVAFCSSGIFSVYENIFMIKYFLKYFCVRDSTTISVVTVVSSSSYFPLFAFNFDTNGSVFVYIIAFHTILPFHMALGTVVFHLHRVICFFLNLG